MGHFYTPIIGIGRNENEAEIDARNNFFFEHGHCHHIYGITSSRFIEKVPPKKRVETPYGRGNVYVQYLPAPDAPESEWLEKWEFEIHSHA